MVLPTLIPLKLVVDEQYIYLYKFIVNEKRQVLTKLGWKEVT